MEKIDAKRLTPNEQYTLRKRIINMRQKGMSQRETSNLLEVSEGHVSRTWSAYKKEGAKSISLGKRGRRPGMKRKLTSEQEKEIRQTIIDKAPDQIKFTWALWTREAVQALIKRQYKINMPLRTISTYLKRWGFTAQRPTKRAYQQDTERLTRWMKEEYPAISTRAKQEQGEIYWADETGVQNSADYQRGFALKGQPPVLMVESKKQKINMLSAITNRGKVRFMIYEDNMEYQKMIDFMKRLIKDADRKVFLIVDNLRVHHAKKVQAWLAENKEKIEVFYLPPYSPESNPDEYLNHDLKLNVHSGLQVRSKDDLKHKINSFMRTLQHNRDHVKSYFRHKCALYAA